MNGFILMLPLLLIRFGLLGFINKDALSRAAFSAPMAENEKTTFIIYQLSNVFLLLFPFILKVHAQTPLFFIGLITYSLGTLILILSTIHFAKPNQRGVNTKGLYQLSRNPMYMGYFIYFLGCALLTASWPLLVMVVVFILCSHRIILAEENWCIQTFGQEYLSYMKRVRRYL